MTAAGKGGGQPDGDDLVRQAKGHDPATHGEHVRVVVLAREPRRIEIVAERGADPGHLVRRDLFALAAATEDDPAIGVAGSHSSSHVEADWRVVHRLFAIGTAVVDGVAKPRERRLQMFFETKAGVIGADGDAHDRQLYYGVRE